MFFEYKGVKIFYETTESGKSPLLLLHGWGASHKAMEMLLRDLSANNTVIAPDFAGHGLSSEPNEPWDVTEYAKMILSLLDHLGITKTDIIAHSFGGRVALYIASERPERVSRLLLTGCAGLPNKPNNKLSAKTKTYKFLKKVADNSFTRAVFGKTVDTWREKLIQRFGSADYKVLSPSMRVTFNKVISQDLTFTLKKINAPTLLVWGENDTATPIWMGEKMEKEIKDCALVRFENAGHFAYAEQYARFLPIARAFLK